MLMKFNSARSVEEEIKLFKYLLLTIHSIVLFFYHVSGNLKIRAYETISLMVRYMDVKLIIRNGHR
jgi:hypothetical protein